MKRCFVLGAGFSKAVAGLPLMKEMPSRFWSILNDIKRRAISEVTPLRRKHLGDLALAGERLWGLFQQLEHGNIEKPLITLSPEAKYVGSDFQENFELILSYVDLHLQGSAVARLSEHGKGWSAIRDRLFIGVQRPDELRHAFHVYIRLALSEPQVDRSLLSTFLARLRSGDRIISFNYDLVVDRALYERGIWEPGHGYGFPLTDSKPKTVIGKSRSETLLFKLHGSLNWSLQDLLGQDMEPVWWEEDCRPVFPGYLVDETCPYLPGANLSSHFGILPSYFKTLDNPTLMRIWASASSALREADEVVVIGYSLPEADSAACVLFGTARIEAKPLVIVDPNSYSVMERFRSVTGCHSVREFRSLEEYVDSIEPGGYPRSMQRHKLSC